MASGFAFCFPGVFLGSLGPPLVVGGPLCVPLPEALCSYAFFCGGAYVMLVIDRGLFEGGAAFLDLSSHVFDVCLSV